jgi:hypothetical protein
VGAAARLAITSSSTSRISPTRRFPEHRAAGETAHATDRLAEGLGHDLLLAEELVHEDRDAAVAVADDHEDPLDDAFLGAEHAQRAVEPQQREHFAAVLHHLALALHRVDGARLRTEAAADLRGGDDEALGAHATIMPSVMARVSGSSIVKVEPCPGFDSIRVRPRIAMRLRRTTSMPTPRPERLVTFSAVEKPGARISRYTS